MTSTALPNGEQSKPLEMAPEKTESPPDGAEGIYEYFLNLVRTASAEIVLGKFKNLFIYFFDEDNQPALSYLFRVIYGNDEDVFLNILNRCCYILVNNWQSTRNHSAIQKLIQAFDDPTITVGTSSPSLKRLRIWLNKFIESQDYKELKLFAARHDSQGHWTSRYTSYLLVHQYVFGKSKEQQEAAKVLSQQLKDRFKFDLAMYTSRSHLTVERPEETVKNPTSLGDDVLRLVKTIVAKRGTFNYINLANIFRQQTEEISYKSYKEALKKYLIYSVEHRGFVNTIESKLTNKLATLYPQWNEEIVTEEMAIATCNRVVEYLTTENGKEPSLLFVLLLSNGNPLTLVIVLLKIALICQSSHAHVEACLANLIRYYESHSQGECQWLINFLEIFRITFAIYAENVEYNLVKIEGKSSGVNSAGEEDNYRIFSLVKSKLNQQIKVIDESA